MPRMIDSVRNSTLPSNMMQFAAKGALLVPPQEMLEILVHLANHNKVFGQQARLTLAGWDEASSIKAASDPKTPKEVLDYLTDPDNLRPALLPALLDNPAVNEKFLTRVATTAHRDQVDCLLQSKRASSSRAVLEILARSSNLTAAAVASVKEKLAALEGAVVPAATVEDRVRQTTPVTAEETAEACASHEATDDNSPEAEGVVNDFLAQHAAEIAAEEHKSFEPVTHSEFSSESTEVPERGMAAAATGSDGYVAHQAPQKN